MYRPHIDFNFYNMFQCRTYAKLTIQEIAEANQSIEVLFEKIEDIKAKASQSENMVQEICADIKKLDFAKNHLQTSVTALKRLQMLITAVGQLEVHFIANYFVLTF